MIRRLGISWGLVFYEFIQAFDEFVNLILTLGEKPIKTPFLEMQGCSRSLSCTLYGFKCCWLGE